MKGKLIFILTLAFGNINAQPLDSLVSYVLQKSIALKQTELEYQVALQKAPQVNQLPDTEFGIGLFPLPVETRLGPQIARLSATQMLPWFGILDRKAELENAKAYVTKEYINEKQLFLRNKLQNAYYRLYEIEQSQAIIQKNIAILKTLERITLTKVESGKSTIADVLQVQLRLEEYLQEIAILETAKTNPTTTINQLLNRDIQIPIGITDSLVFAVLPYEKDSLMRLIINNHPFLKRIDLQQKVAEKTLSVNQLESKPTFGVGLDYIMVNPRKDIEITPNGRDIIQLRGAIKIPLSQQKYEAKATEENLKIATLQHQKIDNISKFQAAIERVYADYEAAQLKYQLYQKQIELTQAAINTLESAYSATGRQFNDLLQLEQQRLDLELKILKVVVQSHIIQSVIDTMMF